MSLLLLYTPILVPICSEWLVPLDLCHLDAAVCNSVARDHFLTILSRCVVENPHFKESEDLEILQFRESYLYFCAWLAFRGMGLKQLKLDPEYPLSRSEAKILSQGKPMESLESRAFEGLIKVMELCPRVNKLRLVGFVDENWFLVLLPKLDGVRSLSFSRSHLGYWKKETHDVMSDTLLHLQGFHNLDEYAHIIIDKFKDLEEVSCVRNPATFESLMRTDNLRYLKLKGTFGRFNNETSLLMKLVEHLRGLRTIIFDEIFASTDIIQKLCECCHNLTSLTLDHATDSILNILSTGCPQLASFRVGPSEYTDDGLTTLVKSCSKLTVLSLASSDCTDIGMLAIIKHCGNLTSFKVSNENITDFPFLRLFDSLPSLIQWSPILSEEITMTAVVANIYDVEYLSFIEFDLSLETEMSSKYRDSVKRRIKSTAVFGHNSAGLMTVFIQCPQLIEICIDQVRIFDDSCMECLVQSCPLLKSIKVRSTRLSPSGFSHLTTYAHNLKVLWIDFCEAGDDVVIPLLMARPNLTKLWLPCLPITDRTLHYLASHCPSMRSVDFSDCKLITEVGVCAIISHRSLSYLDVRNCKLVDGRAVLDAVVTKGRRMSFVGATKTFDAGFEKEEMKAVLGEDLVDSMHGGWKPEAVGIELNEH